MRYRRGAVCQRSGGSFYMIRMYVPVQVRLSSEGAMSMIFLQVSDLVWINS